MSEVATKVNLAQKVTDLAYKVPNQEKYAERKSKLDSVLKDAGWEVKFNSSELEKTNQYGFKAVALANREKNELMIASAGTKLDLNDLVDDLLLAIHRVPNKVWPSMEMVDHLLNMNGGLECTIEQNTKIIVPGHSLGAVNAQVITGYLLSKGIKSENIECITFDNPGAKEVVQRAIDDGIYGNQGDFEVMEGLAECSKVYNARHNPINTTNQQIGEVYLAIPKQQAPAAEATETVADQDTGLWGYMTYLGESIGSAAKGVASMLGLIEIYNQAQSHKLDNFVNIYEEVAVVQTEQWKKVGGQLLVKPFDGQEDIDSTGNDIRVLSESREVISDERGQELASMVEIRAQDFAYKDITQKLGVTNLADVEDEGYISSEDESMAVVGGA